MLLFENASFLVKLKTENLSYGTRIVLGHILYFLLLQNLRVYVQICTEVVPG